ncbi:MAG: aldehyde ferredoxin oxidoreductase family protein [Firmicutes bacterium]|nr:aldehyde ferredoxin oxidoreductase family protein [Bacillota bacterium]
MRGYAGQILKVDLTRGSVSVHRPSEDFYRTYLGGVGIATRLLRDKVPAGIDPLAPENAVVFAVGPYQGTSAPGSGKWVVASKSPLTGTFGSATGGTGWGIELKQAGFDAVEITGAAPEPVFLWIHDGKAEIRSARRLWGLDTVDSMNVARELVGDDKASVATIGPAGEKMVGIAVIAADGAGFAARCGIGAVMGSKSLKAVVVRGTERVEVARRDALAELNKVISRKLYDTAKDVMRKHGTAGIVTGCEAVGDLPIKYWTQDTWPEGAASIGAPRFTEVLKAKPHPCRACPVACHRLVQIPDGSGGSIEAAGAEYESLALLGSNCLVDDLYAVAQANEVCNRLGIDTISAGAFVGFTMECYEKGLIPREDVTGPEPVWGNGEFLVHMVAEIGNATGWGRRFSRGIRHAARGIGPEAEALTVEVKGLDFPAHDPRSYYSLAINYATSPRGACHLHGFPHGCEGGMLLPEAGIAEKPVRFEMEGKGFIAAKFQDFAAAMETMVVCCFMHFNDMTLTETTDIMNAITGFDYTPQQVLEVGERVFNLQRLINVADGISRADDRMPPKMFRPATEGFRAGKVPEGFDEELSRYYELRGWDRNGIPTPEKLRLLGLGSEVK